METLRFSDYCANCRRGLEDLETVFFVEREIGRCFCTEDCIKGYFQPVVEYMREDLGKLRSAEDFKREDRFEEYKQLTLEDPDEIWIDQNESGERYYTFISHYFDDAKDRFYYAVVCLTIDGIPSFIFLNFATKDEDLIEEYRRGQELRLTDIPVEPQEFQTEIALNSQGAAESLAPATSEFNVEKIYSEFRHHQDIPREAFGEFETYIETTLDDPDEIWTFHDHEGQVWYTFMTRFTSAEAPDLDDVEEAVNFSAPTAFYMIVVCQTPGEKKKQTGLQGLEVVTAVPTIDPAFVQQFRKGINSLNKAFGVRAAA